VRGGSSIVQGSEDACGSLLLDQLADYCVVKVCSNVALTSAAASL
jgi:hypothetical protein